jgi:hypothetical protein
MFSMNFRWNLFWTAVAIGSVFALMMFIIGYYETSPRVVDTIATSTTPLAP